MVSRCLAHSFADGPCSVRDFPSGPILLLLVVVVLSGMAWALCARTGAGVGLGGISHCSIEGTVLAGPDQTGATARFSDVEAMAWETAEFLFASAEGERGGGAERLCRLPAAGQQAKSREDKSEHLALGGAGVAQI
jgi:hypothetical protein